MKKNSSAYNFRMDANQQGSSAVGFPRFKFLRMQFVVALVALAFTTVAFAQQQGSSDQVIVTTKDLAAGLWNHYSFKLEATGGVGPYTWHLLSGKLPRKLEFHDFGMIDGIVDEPGTFELTLEVVDRAGARSKPKKLTLTVEPPLTASWSRKAQVDGRRIDGSIKVSNTSGRDFDLTFDVLAVNEIGRATAIGYQHFTLKKNTRDMELPFGDMLSRGDYVVNIDVVGEELTSTMIFRTRLVTPKETVTEGP